MSISAPYKEIAADFMDELSPDAAAIGAVNAVQNKAGKLIGHNTDWVGALKALEESTAIQGRNVALLGAGGAARAIAYGLLDSGAAVTVFNRTHHNGEKLAQEIGVEFGGTLDQAAKFKPEIVVNATTLGMGTSADVPIPDDVFNTAKTVMDIVVSPQATMLLQRAAQHGCESIGGIRMLVHQGAAAFKLFTGQDAPFDAMFAAVQNALAA